MPPRRGGAQGEDQKKKNFEDWTNEEGNTLCETIQKYRKNEQHELKSMHPGTDDILGDW